MESESFGFDTEGLVYFLSIGWIVDARAGGLLIGRPHETGGVLAFVEHEAGKFVITAELEGYEYIVQPAAYSAHKARIEEINMFQGPHPSLSVCNVTPATRMITVAAEPNDRMLLIAPGTFVINKFATARHIEEIEKLNASDNPSFTFSYDYFNPDYWKQD